MASPDGNSKRSIIFRCRSVWVVAKVTEVAFNAFRLLFLCEKGDVCRNKGNRKGVELKSYIEIV